MSISLDYRSSFPGGSIYHRFGDKEGIAAELYVECLRDYQAGLARVLGRNRDAERGIKALVRHHLRWVGRNPQRARFLLERRDAEAAAEERVRELNHETFAAVRVWLAPQIAAGRIREMPLELFYATVLGPCQEHTRQRLRGRTRVSLAETERLLAEAAWGAVRSVERADRHAIVTMNEPDRLNPLSAELTVELRRRLEELTGLLPEVGTSWALTRRLGHQRTFELFAGGPHLSGTEAAELGLANSLHAHEDLLHAAREWCARVESLPEHVATMLKPVLRGAADASWETSIAIEEFAEPQCFTTAAHREAVAGMLAHE